MKKNYIVSLLVVLFLVLIGVATASVGGGPVANAASTIGSNMSTTGTFTVTPATDSATSILFQNTAGANYFVADSTNQRIGVGAAPSTKFEVQGTASASYFLTSQTIQVGSLFASVAYSRFGAGATGHSLAAAQDVLFSGLTEFDGNAFFDSKASLSGNFQMSGRFIADTAASNSFTGSLNVTKSLVVGATTASSSTGYGGYTAEFNSATVGTASFLFAGGRDAVSTTGTCFQMKNTSGNWVYARVVGTTWTVNTLECH